MAGPKTPMLIVSLPGAGQTKGYQLNADTPIKFEFDISEAVFTGNNGNLEIAIEGGGTVIFENYEKLAAAESLPSFVMADGEEVTGDFYLFAFEGAEQPGETELETAADGAANGSGAGEYSDDPGKLGDSIDSLGGQEDVFGAHLFSAAVGIRGNENPVAIDDFNDIIEQGDPDFDPTQHFAIIQNGIVYVYDGETFVESPEGFVPGGRFFELGSNPLDETHDDGYLEPRLTDYDGGSDFQNGFFIDYPGVVVPEVNPVEGNVIENDWDPNVEHSIDTLRMNSIDLIGPDSDGNNPDPVGIPNEGQVIKGMYGELTIHPDGSYSYELDQGLADKLEEGQIEHEVFNYTIQDPVGAESNVAQLTINVFGSNDAPFAVADTNVQAIEQGDSTGYQYPDGYPGAGDTGEVDVDVTTGEDVGIVSGNNLIKLDGTSYGDQILPGADDEFEYVDLSSVFEGGFDFGNQNYSGFYVGSNGYITFGEGSGDFSWSGDSELTNMPPFIAAQFNDIVLDNGGGLYLDIDEASGTVSITWEDVRAWNDYSGSDNSMQIVLHVHDDGDFDFEIRYADMEWAYNSAKGGWSAGDGVNYDLPLSGSEFLNAEAVSNIGHDGVFAWSVVGSEVSSHNYTTQVDAHGNVLTNDTDVDDAADALFVMGVYSAHLSGDINDQTDFALPTVEANGRNVPNTDDVDGDGIADGASFTVQGHYGELTIRADGSYDYILHSPDENTDLDKLNYNNSGEDSFTYAIMDDSGALSYANLTFTVNGANDAPVAYDDANSIIEFGANLFGLDGEVDQAGTVSGNVIMGMDDGVLVESAKDTDVDDTEIFVSKVYTKRPVETDPDFGEGDGGYEGRSADGFEINESFNVYGNDIDGDGVVDPVTIQGNFGTLIIHEDGNYSYELNNGNRAVQRLNTDDDPLTDTFFYTVRNEYNDGVESNEAQLDITIYGNNDDPVIKVTGKDHHDGEFIEAGVHGDGTGATHVLGTHDLRLNDVDNSGKELTVTLTELDDPQNPIDMSNDIIGFDISHARANALFDADPTDAVTQYSYKGLLITIDNDANTVTMEAADGKNPGFNQYRQALKMVTFEIDGSDHTPDTSPREFEIMVEDNQDGIEPGLDIDGVHHGETGVATDTFTLNIVAANDAPTAIDDGIYAVTELSDVITDGGCFLLELLEDLEGFVNGILAELGLPFLPHTEFDIADNVFMGNLLTNDFDVDGYVDENDSTDDPNNNANDLHDLRVTGLAAGNFDNEFPPIDAPDGTVDLDPAGGFEVQGIYGTLYIDALGNFTYVADTDAANRLADGHYATETFTYQISDGDAEAAGGDGNDYNNPAFDTATVTFKVNGSNDQATIEVEEGEVNDDGVAIASVQEAEWADDAVDPNVSGSFDDGDATVMDDFSGSTGEDTGTTENALDQFGNYEVTPAATMLSVGGKLEVTDPDDHTLGQNDPGHSQTPVIDESTLAAKIEHDGSVYEGSFVEQADGSMEFSVQTSEGGTFSINPDGTWNYEIDNTLSEVQSMGQGESFEQTFTVYSYDDTANQTITVTVEGSNDAPVINSITAPVETFESGAGGWDIARTSAPVDNVLVDALNDLLHGVDDIFNVDLSNITNVLENRFLGMFSDNEHTAKTFYVDPDADTVTVEFDMFEHGLWGGEFLDSDNFTVNVGDAHFEIPLSAFEWFGIIPTGLDHENFTVKDPATDATLSIFSPDGPAGAFIHHISVSMTPPADGELTVDLSANTESSFWEGVEAFGIDNVSVASYGEGEVPMFSVVENVTGDTFVAQFGSTDVDVNDDPATYTVDKVQALADDGSIVDIDLTEGMFSMVGNTLVAHGGAEGFDHETYSEFYVTVTPHDDHEAGQDVVVTVHVGDVNEAPIAIDDYLDATETNVDAWIGIGNVGDVNSAPGDDFIAKDYDPDDGDAIDSYQFISSSHPAVKMNADGLVEFDQDHPDFNHLAKDATDTITLTYKAYDGELYSDPATVTVTVIGTNDVPTFDLNGDGDGVNYADTYTENHSAVSITGGSVIMDVDDGASIAKATVSFTPSEPEDLTAFNLNLDPGWSASSVTDITTGMITWTITGPSGASMAEYQDALDGMTFGNPADQDPLDGNREFTITVYDEHGGTASAKSVINVEPVNDAPVALDNADAVHEPNESGHAISTGTAPMGNVIDDAGTAGTDYDVDNPTDSLFITAVKYNGVLTAIAENGPTEIPDVDHGTMRFWANGDYEYIADDNSLGVHQDPPVETFEYTLSDGSDTSLADLKVTVTPVNDAPVAESDSLTVVEDTTEYSQVTATDVDLPAGTDLTFALNSNFEDAPEGLTFNGDGSWSFNADAYDYLSPTDDSLHFKVGYTATDDQGATGDSFIEITVTGTNDAPVLDLSAGTVNFVEEGAGYNNMLGFYQLVNGKPVNPEIIMENVNDSDPSQAGEQAYAEGDILTTYGDGAELHYFLVNVEYGDTPTGTPEFVWDTATEQWAIQFTDGTTVTQFDARFDNPDLNPAGEEATFGDPNGHHNPDNSVELDDQLMNGDQFGLNIDGDDDDYDDVVAQENPGDPSTYNSEGTYYEGDPAMNVTGAVDISDVDSDFISQITVSMTHQTGDVLTLDGNVVDSSTGTVTLNGHWTPAEAEDLIESMTFSNDNDALASGDRAVNVQVWDDASNPVGAPSNEAVATIHVNGFNDGPTAVDDGSVASPLSVAEDGSITINVTGNDTDPENDQLFINSYDSVAHKNADGSGDVVGTVALNATGDQLVFTPTEGYDGPAYFTYDVNDGDLTSSNRATVSLNVIDGNAAPTPTDDPGVNGDGVTSEGTYTATEAGVGVESNPSNYLLVVDTSASMAGSRMVNTQNALYEMLETLQNSLEAGESTNVGIIDFDTDTVVDTFELKGDDTTGYLAARGFVATLQAWDGIDPRVDNGTNYVEALTEADAWLGAHEGPAQMIFMSDGEPTPELGGDSWMPLATALHTDHPDATVTAISVEMPAEFTANMNLIDGDHSATMLSSSSDLNGLLVDLLNNVESSAIIAEGNVLTNDTDPDGDDMSVMTISYTDPDTSVTETADLDSDITPDVVGDALGAVIVGKYGTLTINVDGDFDYNPNQPAANALGEGDAPVFETFSYTIKDFEGLAGTGAAEITFQINGANDAPVATNALGHGAMVNEVSETVTDFGWTASGDEVSLAFAGNSWAANAANKGVTFEADNSLDRDASIVKVGIQSAENHKGALFDYYGYEDDNGQVGQGVEWTRAPFSSWQSQEAYEIMVINFGGKNKDMPIEVELQFGDVASGETLHFIVYDQNDNRTTISVDPVNGTNGKYIVSGVQAQPGDDLVLIKSIHVDPGNGDGFTLKSIKMTEAGQEAVGSHQEVSSQVSGASGNLFGNMYDPDAGDAANSVELVGDIDGDGSLHGQWGTLAMGADGSWTYTPDTDIYEEHAGDLPGLETFTYEVTDGFGATDIATLTIPVHYNVTPAEVDINADNVIVDDAGSHSISGGNGDDFLYGESGDDFLNGGADNDYLSGGAGDDDLVGGHGNDMLFGDGGNDHIYVSSGTDTVTLGEGADTIHVDPTWIPSSGGTLEVTDFDVMAGDVLDLGASTNVQINSDGSQNNDLVLTMDNDGAAVEIVLQGVLTTNTGIGTVDVDMSNDDVNSLIQQIIDSPDQF
ncbi:hypothetical protein SYK_32330 [Pseudodesulfovibrio nedwellii]|uniref:Tandem-95 repeat protein n=1 Tax=Pseudodesulfovibrio nedwellii TaxID=2973072 RepID=A0ABN6S921_9BACT|nr:VCBS domain-containing protein [Pseudodesulfovibrio nedwellii]BDQ38873.1 hypothetical protein SYK_32330 [Pseudodesulfovibrio nedwellii]